MHDNRWVLQSTNLVKRISHRPRAQRLALPDPEVLGGLCTVHDNDGDVPHLHLIHVAVPPRPFAVLGRGVGADR